MTSSVKVLLLVYITFVLTIRGSAKKKIPLHLMGMVPIHLIQNQGWSTSGVIPAIEMALDDINHRSDILTDYILNIAIRDTKVFCHCTNLVK